jgi:phosphate:Na+ symporter
MTGIAERRKHLMPEQTIKDVKKEIYLIMHKAQEMLELTEDGFTKNKVLALDQADELAKEIHAKEDLLTGTLAKIASANNEARTLLAVPSHIEKIATSIKRITENSRARIKEGLLFSDKAILETGRLFTKAKDALKKAGEAAVTGAQATVESAVAESDAIERMANDFATAHEDRLVTGECSPKSSSIYLCILYAFEDMGAHIKDAVKKLSGKQS